MKKLMAVLLTLSMVIGAAISVSAAPADTAAAQDGDLIYTFNFKGEEGVFTPDGSTNFKAAYTAEVSEDGTSVTVKSIAGAVPATNNRNLWGGTLGNLELTAADAYTLVYKAKANGTANAENLLAVAGVLKAFSTLDGYSELLSNKGNYDTGAETMSDTANFAFSMGNSTFAAATKASALANGIDVDNDGFMTVMVAYNGISGKITAYVLSKEGDVENAEDWEKLWQANGNPGKLCFMVSAGTTAVDTTIKDARIYKGVGYGNDPVVDDNPGGDNPGEDNPGGDNPGGDNPGGDNPGGDNPGGDNPGGGNNSGDTGNSGNGNALSPKTGDMAPTYTFVMLVIALSMIGGLITVKKTYRK